MMAKSALRAILAAVVFASAGAVTPALAASYTSRRASHGEAAAMVASAGATGVCGWSGQTRQLSRFRVVAYRLHGVLIKWGATVWNPPGGQECVFVFLHASSARYFYTKPPDLHRAKVTWLPFTWGSSPFDNAAYLDRQWDNLRIGASPPGWVDLSRALVLPLF
jgi:hypothetical protein